MSHSRNVIALLQRLALGPIAASLLYAAPVHGAEVRGIISLPPEIALPTLGYTHTRVAAPSAAYRAARGEAAVFLRVKESLPLPPPSTKWPVKVSGLRIEPGVMACAVDESLEITNAEKTPVTLSIGGESLAPIAPGATLTYLCQQAGPQKVRVTEWPHVRGLVYVGEVGVSGVLKDDGKFSISAPDGQFTLGVVGVDGVLVEMPVVIAGKDVDVGKIEPKKGTQPAEAAPAPAPVPSEAPKATEKPKPPASAAPPKPAEPTKPKPTPQGDDEIDLEP